MYTISPFLILAVTPADEIRGIKSLEHFAYSPLIYIIPAIIILLSIIALFFFYKKRRKMEEFEKQLSIPAYKIALHALEKLKIGKFDYPEERSFHFSLSEILRFYIEEEFGIFASDMTTEEVLLNILKVNQLTGKQVEILSDILIKDDKVKFAKLSLGPQIAEAMLLSAKEFVKETHKPDVEEVNEVR